MSVLLTGGYGYVLHHTGCLADGVDLLKRLGKADRGRVRIRDVRLRAGRADGFQSDEVPKFRVDVLPHRSGGAAIGFGEVLGAHGLGGLRAPPPSWGRPGGAGHPGGVNSIRPRLPRLMRSTPAPPPSSRPPQ